ncbi:hypothetical protein [Caballeronia sp. INDeC2]|uniref:hypothetical protein n=1 Tax=Caballeronia sp. INDeC2 TaxID=2921747 RepID=UPI0020277109|nr:hypothetical protein [Caballeronia sp. INDeC2]
MKALLFGGPALQGAWAIACDARQRCALRLIDFDAPRINYCGPVFRKTVFRHSNAFKDIRRFFDSRQTI